MYVRFTTLIAVVLAGVFALSTFGSAAAQGPNDGSDRPAYGPRLNDEEFAELAAAFGITTDELQAYFDNGLRLPDIADELGIDLSTIDVPYVVAFLAREQEKATLLGITVEELRAYRQEGLSIKDIAEQLGVELPARPLNEDRAAEIAAALGITVEELQAYHDEGLTIREIAEELGIDLSTVELPRPDGRRGGPNGGQGGRGGQQPPAGAPNGDAPAADVAPQAAS